MDYQTLDEMQYLYDNEQLSQEEYRMRGRKSLKKMILTATLLDSYWGDGRFNQMLKDYSYDEDEIL